MSRISRYNISDYLRVARKGDLVYCSRTRFYTSVFGIVIEVYHSKSFSVQVTLGCCNLFSHSFTAVDFSYDVDFSDAEIADYYVIVFPKGCRRFLECFSK